MILCGFYLVKLQTARAPSLVQNPTNDPYLHILRISPSGKTTLPEKISIKFSDPVQSHAVSHFFLLSPATAGHFMDTDDPTIVSFVPDAPFERGVHYSIQIGLGLKSTNGKILQTDESSSFDTEIANNEVKFIKDDITGRVFTLPVDAKRELTIQRGNGISELTISVYKSTETQFMAYLAYQQKSETTNGYTQTEKTYISESIPHSQFQLISSIKQNDSENTIQIPNEVGIYYVEALGQDKKTVGSTYALVNRTGLLFRQDDHQVTLSAFDALTGMHLKSPLNVEFYHANTRLQVVKSLVLSDLIKTAYDFDQPLDFILAKTGEERIFVPVNLPNSQADIQVNENLSQSYKTFIYTDRPIYKPGDTVLFRGIVRVDNDGLYTLPPEGLPVQITVSLTNISKNLDTTVTLGKSGTFWGSLKLPEDYSPKEVYEQTQYVSVKVNGKQRINTWSDAYFDIVAYKKPAFDIKSNVEKKEYVKQEEMVFNLEAASFDGTPLANQTLSYDIYQDTFYEVEKAVYNSAFNITRNSFGMCGGGFSSPFEEYYGTPMETNKPITTDQNGKATLRYSLKDKQMDASMKVTLLAYKTDGNNNKIVSAITTIVHAAEENVFFYPAASTYTVGDELKTSFYGETLTGQKVANRQFTVKLQEQLYGQGTPHVFSEQQITTDDNGLGAISMTIPSVSSVGTMGVNLLVETKDQYGNSVKATKYLNIQTEKPKTASYWDRVNTTPTFFKMRADKNSYLVGDTLTVHLTSPKELDVLMTMERGRIYEPRIIHINQGENTLPIPIVDELSPSITTVFSFFANGEYFSEGITLNVPAMHKLMNVTVTPDKTEYKPGETARLTIKTTDKNGSPISSRLSLAVVDKAIFALRKNATPPIHSTLYGFRPRKTNSSSSLTWVGTYDFGGRGGGGGGGGLDGKDLDTLFWNPDIMTDLSGTVIVDVPLSSQTTTWKALVYGTTDESQAGQGEIDFLAKNN